MTGEIRPDHTPSVNPVLEWSKLDPLDQDLGGGQKIGNLLWQWTLVLQALGIPHKPHQSAGRWILLVPGEWESPARKEIREFMAEAQTVEPSPVHHGPDTLGSTLIWTAGFILAGLRIQGAKPLFGFSAWDWITRGRGDSSLMLDGQWYRSATALLLHADVGHLLANALGLAFFTGLASRRMCSGCAWLAALVAGCLGNALNAWFRGPGHLFLGASTAVFGSVGLLSGMAVALDRPGKWVQAGVPVAAGLGMLALLGTSGERTDLGAHLFGFVSGLALGSGAGFRLRGWGRPGRMLAFFCGLIAVLMMAGAWFLALG
jgi:membrane associated rhomboid family serine protease